MFEETLEETGVSKITSEMPFDVVMQYKYFLYPFDMLLLVRLLLLRKNGWQKLSCDVIIRGLGKNPWGFFAYTYML